MDSKNKNFDDIRRLSQSIEIKSKILKKYLDYFDKEEIDFINNSIKYRDKFDNEIMNQNPNLELYINGFNSINNTLNGFIEYLKESNLYISESNMKKSELKQIIKEEVRSILEIEDPSQTALDTIARSIGVKGISGPSKNKFRNSETKLPNYDMLPEKRTDVNYADNNKISIFLPSISGNGTTGIYSKQDVDTYVEEFKKAFGESPKFVVTGEKVEIGNDKFAQKQDLFRKAMGTFGTQGD